MPTLRTRGEANLLLKNSCSLDKDCWPGIFLKDWTMTCDAENALSPNKFSTKVNANPPYLNDYSSNDELDVESIPTLDDSLPVTSKRVLAPTTTKEIVRNIKKKTTNNNVSNTLNMLLGTEAEAAALRKAQTKAAEATAATALSALENKNRELAITEERLAIHKAEHNMNMRLKEVEWKREEMKARMDVLKMRIELKKGDPTIPKDELDTFLPLP